MIPERAVDVLERLSDPDRLVDAMIFREIGMPLPKAFCDYPIALTYDEMEDRFTMPVGDLQVTYEHPRYTASIEAALTLVPDKWSWAIGVTEGKSYPTARLGRSYPTNATVAVEHSYCVPIAICHAAMKARLVR